MTSRHSQPTSRRLASLLAICAFVAAQTAAAMCDCRLQTASQAFIAAPIVVDSCCARHGADATPTSDGCKTAPTPADDDCPGCTCSIPLPPATLTAPATADLDAPSTLHFAGLSTPTSLDLSIAVASAFDLILPGGPPGLRLHALLGVWRN